jgi:hypothetical protein
LVWDGGYQASKQNKQTDKQSVGQSIYPLNTQYSNKGQRTRNKPIQEEIMETQSRQDPSTQFSNQFQGNISFLLWSNEKSRSKKCFSFFEDYPLLRQFCFIEIYLHVNSSVIKYVKYLTSLIIYPNPNHHTFDPLQRVPM